MNRDLMLAVLSMDAYSDESKDIGTAVALPSTFEMSSGFFARAYSYNGETIISYRGTDAPKILDALTGYLTSLGGPSLQAVQAASFYQAVVGQANVYSANVTFTGHSLGGGLAGLMAGLYGHDAVMFDNMAFRDAATWTYDQATTLVSVTPPGPNPFYQPANAFFYPGVEPGLPEYSGISGYRLDGQFLNFQSEGTLVGDGVSWGFGLTAPLDLHSMALLVLNMYAEQTSGFDPAWKSAARYMGQPLLGLPEDGINRIAYSVVNEGERPNGDVAAHSLFNDAGDVGKFLDGAGSAPFYFNWGEGLASIAVQFSKQQADHAVMATSAGTEGDGIFHDSDVGLYLSLDSTVSAWGEGASITGWETLKSGFLNQLQAENGKAVSSDAISTLNAVDFALFATGGVIDLPLNGDNPMVLAGQISDSATASGFVYGSDKVDLIQGSKNADFLIGANSSDTLVGGDGKDVLMGGEGADVLVLGNINGVNAAGSASAPEVMDGGAGSDYLVVTGAVGDTVKVGKGDAEDRLLVHTSLLGLPDAAGGKIGMFELLGGVFEATPYLLDNVFTQNFNKDSNLFTDAQGQKYRAYYYSDSSNQGLEYSHQILGADNIPYVMEYRQYTGSSKLDIRILGAYVDVPGLQIKTPDDSARPVLETITIENFQIGDYGIQLPKVFLPYGSHDTGDILDPALLDGMYNAAVVAAYDKAIHAISDTALSYSLTSDGALQGAGLRSAFASTPEINADHLKIAIDGGAGADRLVGNDVAEVIRGGAGDDTLTGNGGDDRIQGDAGADRLIGGAGADLIDGGSGTDTADYRTSGAAVAVDLFAGTGSGGDAAGDVLLSIENLAGSQFGDVLTGDDGVNRLQGFEGADRLYGGAGNDRLIGGLGADMLDGGVGTDVVDYSASALGVVINLTSGTGVYGDAAGDRYVSIENVDGSAFGDVMTGDSAVNRLNGLAGNDTLSGGAGNDYLLGDLGNDNMTGGAGADVFVFNAHSGRDVITDFWAGAGRTDRAQFLDGQFVSFADVLSHSSNSSAGVVITINAEDSLTLKGVMLAQLNADDFLFA